MKRACLAIFAGAISCFSATSALQRGAELFKEGQLAAAETALLEAVREQPDSAVAQKLLGLAYSAQEKYQKAEEPLREACRLNPAEENACYYLGRVYYSLNRYADSEKAFAVALKQPKANRTRVHHGLALTREALGQVGPAEVSYKLSVESGDRSALTDFGMFLFRHGRGNEALVYLNRAGAKDEVRQVQQALAATPPGTTAQAKTVLFTPMPLPMVVRNGAVGSKHQIETMPAGVAVFDFDNDGWADIYIANGAAVPSLRKADATYSNRLFRNNRDGTFSDVTAKARVAGVGFCMGVAAADFDNDGWVDLFIAGVNGHTLYRNRGDGSFEDVTKASGLASDGRWSVAAGWFDYDNDGLLDLFVVRYVDWNPLSEPYCGGSKPGHRTYCHPEHYKPLPNALFHNNGNGTFSDVSIQSGIATHPGKGMGVVFGDFDRDGLLDIFVANDTTPNSLFHNTGDGHFEELALRAGVALNSDGAARSAMGADFRDYDNDGREDLFVTDLTNERFLLYRNVGKGEFADVSAPSGVAAASLPWTGWSIGMFDLDNDGLKDVFVAGGNVTDNAELTSSRQSRQPNLIFLNRGGGQFAMQQLPGLAFHRGAAFGDFNHDGRIDVVVTRLNEAPLVLLNTTQSGHWLKVRLEGTGSNRDGIGAELHLVTASGSQWNRVTTSVGYGGSSDKVVHFGLGKDTSAEILEIKWPSGKTQSLSQLRADQLVVVKERL